jgi:hypothetical protein
MAESEESVDVRYRLRRGEGLLEDRRMRRDPDIGHHRGPEQIDELISGGDLVQKGARSRRT